MLFKGMYDSLVLGFSYIPVEGFILVSIFPVFGCLFLCLGIFAIKGRGLKTTGWARPFIIHGVTLFLIPSLMIYLSNYTPNIKIDEINNIIPYKETLLFFYSNFHTLFILSIIGIVSSVTLTLFMDPVSRLDKTGATGELANKHEIVRHFGYVSKNRVIINKILASVFMSGFLWLFYLVYLSIKGYSFFHDIFVFLLLPVPLYIINDHCINYILSNFPREIDSANPNVQENLTFISIGINNRLSRWFEESRDFVPLGKLVVGKNKTTNQIVAVKGRKRNEHIGIWGPSGAGKTEGYVYPSILSDIWHSDRSIFVLDKKSPDMFKRLAGAAYKNNMRVIFFDPWQDEYCPRFNPLGGVGDDSIKKEEIIRLICDVFIGQTTDIGVSDDERFFRGKNRIFLELLLLMLFTYPEKERTLPNSLQVIESLQYLTEVAEKITFNEKWKRLRDKWNDFKGFHNETKLNTMDSIRERLSLFKDPAVNRVFSGNDFNLNILFEKDVRTLLIIGCPEDKGDYSRILASLFVKLMFNTAFVETRTHSELNTMMLSDDKQLNLSKDDISRIKKKRELSFYLEEGDTMAIPNLPDVFRLARFTGVNLFYIGQEQTALKKYKENYDSIISNMGTKIYARGLSSVTCEELSRKIGDIPLIGKESIQRGYFEKVIRDKETVKRLLTPDEIYHLPENRFLVFPPNSIRPFLVDSLSVYSKSKFIKKMQIPFSSEVKVFKPESDFVIKDTNITPSVVSYKDANLKIKPLPDGESAQSEIQTGISDKPAMVRKKPKLDETDNQDIIESMEDKVDINTLPTPLKTVLEDLQIKSDLKDKEMQNIVKLIKNLEGEVSCDAMTGLYNRRMFDKRLNEEINKFTRHNIVFSLFMFDIDKFKNFNDTYGHQIGDEVLKNVATVAKDSIRDEDIACRYGGEEFAIIFPSTSGKHAYDVADKLRNLIENNHIPHNGGNLKVTISGGVAEMKKGMSLKQLIEAADQLLYKAKEEGRNRIYL